MLVVIVAMLAFAIDVGFLLIAKTELQRSADAAAMAGAWELREAAPRSNNIDLTDEILTARLQAQLFAAANNVCNASPSVDLNKPNSSSGDVVVGHLADPTDPNCAMDFSDPGRFNAVQVRVRRTSSQNGEVPLFFARIFGTQGKSVEAQATAALLNNFEGFEPPEDGSNLPLLPFALDVATWKGMLAGGGTDGWKFNSDTGKVSPGSDRVREVNLYPQGTGSPANRGTVDIGPSNNSTADIARQILRGVTQADLDYVGGELRFNSRGELYLNGDPGISAGVKNELAAIIGQPRIIPIFSSVKGPGNNAQYTIVEFAGVRICEVVLTGNSKRVIIQPASLLVHGGIPGTGEPRSSFLYSPVWLVR